MILKAKSYNLKANTGFSLILSITVVGAVALGLVLALLTLNQISIITSSTFTKSNQAQGLSDACAETALQQIRNSTPYTGTGNLTFGSGTCDYTVTDLGGENREIISQGTLGDIVSRVKISINTINPQINIVSWQEVDEF